LVIGTQRFRSKRNKAAALSKRPEFTRVKLKELAETDFDNWVKKESFGLAKEVAYHNGELKGSLDRADAPLLPESYARPRRLPSAGSCWPATGWRTC